MSTPSSSSSLQIQRDTESPPVLVSSGDSPDCSYDGDHSPDAASSSDPLLLLPQPPKDRNHLISSIEKRVQQSLAYYVRFTASAAHQDKLLKLLQWSLWIWGTLLQPQQTAATTTASRSRRQLRYLALSRWVLKLYGEVSMARYVTRLLGFPHAVEAVVNSSWTASSTTSTTVTSDKQNMLNTVYSAIGKVLSWSMVGYHPTELAAYVLWMKPAASALVAPSVSAATTERHRRDCERRRSWFPQFSTWPAETWSYVSCRFWLAYVVAELLQCVVQGYELRSLLQDGPTTKEMEILEDTNGEGHTTKAQLQRRLDHVTLQGLRNVLFLVPCLQWSLPHWDTRPWLPVSTINTLMWLESIVCLYQALRHTP
jgi:hypothetical protein